MISPIQASGRAAHPAHARPGAEHERRDHGREGHRRGGVREHLHREARRGRRSHATGRWRPAPPPRRRPGRRSRRRRAARPLPRAAHLDQQRDQHPAGEVGQERDRRVGGDGAPAGEIVDVVPRQAGDRQRAEEQGLAAARCAPAAARPARSAAAADRRPPRRSASMSRRSASAACPASSSARTGRTAAARLRPPAGAPARRRPGREQHERPDQRDVVGGRDAGRAPHEVAADGDRRAALRAPRGRTRGTAGSPTARRTSRTRPAPRTGASSPTSRGAARPCSAAGRSTRGSRTRSARRSRASRRARRIGAVSLWSSVPEAGGGGEAVERSNRTEAVPGYGRPMRMGTTVAAGMGALALLAPTPRGRDSHAGLRACRAVRVTHGHRVARAHHLRMPLCAPGARRPAARRRVRAPAPAADPEPLGMLAQGQDMDLQPQAVASPRGQDPVPVHARPRTGTADRRHRRSTRCSAASTCGTPTPSTWPRSDTTSPTTTW